MGRDELVRSYHSLNEENNVLSKKVETLETECNHLANEKNLLIAENERWVRRIKELERRAEMAIQVLGAKL